MRTAPFLLVFLAGCWPFLPQSFDEYTNEGSDVTDEDTTPDDDRDRDTDPDRDTEPDRDTDLDEDTEPNGTCIDDSREDDDTFGQATALQNNSSRSGTLCPNDPDFMRLTIPAECEATLELAFDEEQGNLDLFLFSGEDQVGWSDRDNTSFEEITFLANGGEYVVIVEGNQDDSADYTLNLDVDCDVDIGECVDDSIDTNGNDDTRTSATVISSFPMVIDGQICEGDDDWYELDTALNCRINVLVEHEYVAAPLNDVDVQIVGIGNNVLALAESSTDDEVISDFHVAQRSWIRVYGYQTTESPYTLVVEETCPE